MKAPASIPRAVFTSVAIGMLVMAIFTFLWGLGPFFVWRAAGLPVAVVAAGVTGFLILDAIRLLHQTRHFPLMTSPDDRVRAARTWRLFGITFAVEGLVIAIVSTVLSIADLGDFIPPRLWRSLSPCTSTRLHGSFNATLITSSHPSWQSQQPSVW